MSADYWAIPEALPVREPGNPENNCPDCLLPSIRPSIRLATMKPSGHVKVSVESGKETWMTPFEAATGYHYAVTTIRSFISHKQLEASKRNGRLHVSDMAMEEFIANRQPIGRPRMSA